MAGGSFNIALGREVEFHARVDGNDPTNAALVLVALASSGLEVDSVLKDYDTLSAILAASNNEVTNAGYSRIVISDTGLAAYVVDDSNDETRLPLVDQVFASIVAGDSWRKLLLCYDSDSTAGGDANIVPVKFFDILSPVTGQAIVPSGGDILFSFPNGYHIAS